MKWFFVQLDVDLLQHLKISNFIPVEFDTNRKILASTSKYKKMVSKEERKYAPLHESKLIIFNDDDELPVIMKLKFGSLYKIVTLSDEVADAIRFDNYVYFSNTRSKLFQDLVEATLWF